MRLLIVLSIVLLLLIQCKSVKQSTSSNHAPKIEILKKLISKDSILSKHYVGFKLYNLKTNITTFAYNEDRLFIPASNIKLLTYFTCLNILEDSLTAFRYKLNKKDLMIAPNADPSFLNSDIDSNQLAFNFLKKTNLPITIIKNPKDNINTYGNGWAWDDNNYNYQAPLSYFPLYGNKIKLTSLENSSIINIDPPYFESNIQSDATTERFLIRKDFNNTFLINPLKRPDIFTIQKPFLTSDSLILKLLSDTLNQKVSLLIDTIDTKNWKSQKNIKVDSLYKRMLLVSDNQIAEQLLLMASNELLGFMDIDQIIKVSMDSILCANYNTLKWVDGSGLSRYNLASPSLIVHVLTKLFHQVPFDKLKSYLPNGKPDDTLPSIFNQKNSWIFAKTGSLSNNYSLSGYLITDQQNTFAFSFMNNNFTSHKEDVYASINKTLLYIKRNF